MLRDDISKLRDDISMLRDDISMLKDGTSMLRDDISMLKDGFPMYDNPSNIRKHLYTDIHFYRLMVLRYWLNTDVRRENTDVRREITDVRWVGFHPPCYNVFK
jgi:hypothetical protein